VRDDEATAPSNCATSSRSTSSRRRAFAVPGPPGKLNELREKCPSAGESRSRDRRRVFDPSVLVFVTSAMLILVGAIGVISVKNPVHAALCLIMTLFGVAVAFVAQSPTS